MKKNLALGLSTVLAVTALSACGTANSAPQAPAPATAQTATATSTPTADTSAQDREACVQAASAIGVFLSSGRTPSTTFARLAKMDLKEAAEKAGSTPIAEAISNSAQWMDIYLAAETSFADPNLLLGTVTTCDKAGYIRGDKVLAMRAK